MIMLGAYTNKQYAALMKALGYEDIAAEVMAGTPADLPARREHDAALLAEILKKKSANEWEELLNANHVPAARVRTLDEALTHPQYASRDVLQQVEGLTGARPAAAFLYDQGGPEIDGPPPRYAENTSAVLQELGVDETHLADLAKRGVIAI
jgi:crotonobetainyl-CoA:carnitine CoA-transferase CaiB-like acyl-CoA transferase